MNDWMDKEKHFRMAAFERCWLFKAVSLFVSFGTNWRHQPHLILSWFHQSIDLAFSWLNIRIMEKVNFVSRWKMLAIYGPLVFEDFGHTKLITEWKNLIAFWVVDYFVGLFVCIREKLLGRKATQLITFRRTHLMYITLWRWWWII